MKKKHFYGLMMSAAVLLLAGCTADVQPESVAVSGTADGDQVPVNFSVSSQQSITRAATNIVSFDANEALKVFVKPAGADSYTAYTYTTASAGQSNVALMAPDTPPYFPYGAGTTVQAYAYYPASAVVGETFSVQADQTSNANYKASDLMFAANRTITKGSAEGTNLAMSHLMAQLHLNITGQNVTVNRVVVNARRSVTFAVSTAGVPSTTLTADAASDIIVATGSGDAYVCIPQQQMNEVTIKVEMGVPGDAATTATYTFSSSSDFAAGSSYPVNLTISATQVGAVTAITDWSDEQDAINLVNIGTTELSLPTASPYIGALPGKFTINDNGAQVYFSQGNLRATYDGSDWTWSFAENQWDYIGNNAANTSVNGSGTISGTGTVDLFGWVGASSTWTGVAQYGISNSTTNSDYGDVATEGLKSDWGTLAISNGGNTANSGWRTLTQNEWLYVTNTRSTPSGKRYARATVNGVNGMILLPDDWRTTYYSLSSTNSSYANFANNSISPSDWYTKFALHGCVFLPAAGYYVSNVSSAGSKGYYWSSSSYTSGTGASSFTLYTDSWVGGLTATILQRYYRCSVRLVRNTDYVYVDPGVTLAESTVGMLVASNGKAYTSANYDTSFGDPVAVVGYKNGSNGYAIALINSSSQTWNEITNSGSNKNTDCTLADGKRGSVPVAPTGTTWKILTKENYSKLFQAMGSTVTSNSSYYYDSNVNGMITAYSSYGGTALSGGYWSTSESSSGPGWVFGSSSWGSGNKTGSGSVRPVLAW